MKRTRPLWLMAASLVLAVVGIARLVGPAHPDAPPPPAPRPSEAATVAPRDTPSVTISLSCTVSYRNRGARPADARVWLPLPASCPPCVQVVDVACTPRPVTEMTLAAGTRIAVVELRGVHPGKVGRAEVRCRMRITPLLLDVDARQSKAPPAFDRTLRPYLRAEPGIPCDDPIVRGEVVRVLGGQTNPWYALVALFDDVRAYRFLPQTRSRDVREVLRTRQAQCADAAALLVTLARAAGIPARTVSGIYRTEGQSETRDLHAWAEAWIEGVGWVPLDPTMARFDDATRATRIAAQGAGYVPLWVGTAPVLRGQVVRPPGAPWESADFEVAFRWEVEETGRPASLLDRFPVPTAPTSGGAAATPRETFDVLARVRFLLWTRQLGRALAALQAAIARDPVSPELWRTAVMAYVTVELWEGAARASEQALVALRRGAAPPPPEVTREFLQDAGQAWLRVGDYDRARQAFAQAVRVAPTDAWLHGMLGWAMLGAGDRDGARAELSIALSAGPGLPDHDLFARMRQQLRLPVP